MSTLVQLALGDSAAGCLRGACQAHGLPGIAVGIPDDLSHGPLDDGYARINYMRALYSGYDDWTFDANDAFAPWSALIGQLDRERPSAVVIWSGDNVSERTFLAMACWQLQGRSEAICGVAIPSENGPPYVALQSPADLTQLYPSHQQISDHKRAMLCEDFERIRRETGLLRRLEQGRIIGISSDHYDRQLMDCCTVDWTPAPRIVGAAMARCDPHNLMSDLFFASRLQILIDAGCIEANAARIRLRDYSVRLAQS